MADNQPPMASDDTGPPGSPSPPPPPGRAPSGDQPQREGQPPPPPPPPPSPQSSADAAPEPGLQFFRPPLPATPPGPTPAPPAGGHPAPSAAPSGLPDLGAPAPFEAPAAAATAAPSATELTKPSGKRRTGLIAVIAGLIVLIAGGSAAGFLLTRPAAGKAGPTITGGSGGGAATQTAVGTPTAAGTVSYTDPEQYYTAHFASEPTYHATSQTSPVGNVPYRYAEYVGPDVDQLVGVLVFSPGTSFDTTKGLQGIASAGNGSVVSSTPSTFQGYPSLEGVINLQGDYLKVQIVHVGNLAYIIGTAGPVNPPSDYARFIAAVHITPH